MRSPFGTSSLEASEDARSSAQTEVRRVGVMRIVDVPDNVAEKVGIGFHDGHEGLHTLQHAPGAMPNGTTIYKVIHIEGDMGPLNSKGVILGSMLLPPEVMEKIKAPHDADPYFYFVEFEHSPRYAVAIRGWALGLAPV
jgi:hypothetical protein